MPIVVKSPDLQINRKFEEDAPEGATLVIQVDPRKPLPKGTYVFELRVVDDGKNTSAPTTFKLVVFDDKAPTAVINGPERVPFREPFTLSGAKSFDVDDGKVVHFIWTLVEAPPQ
jgi:hypothetical protein